jgi:hypothetical protein
MNDGNLTGIKQDRFRNSNFEYDLSQEDEHFGGVSRATPNTLGVGRFNENRGRRGDEEWTHSREDNPFENGKLRNWNRRQGWDQYYDRSFDRGNRPHGGALQGHDARGLNRGRGPRGYKRPDQRIYEDVCEMLSRSADVDASGIEVTVKEGIVYLNGSVDGRQMKRMAELEIENISGVTDVQNLLAISKRPEGNLS